MDRMGLVTAHSMSHKQPAEPGKHGSELEPAHSHQIAMNQMRGQALLDADLIIEPLEERREVEPVTLISSNSVQLDLPE